MKYKPGEVYAAQDGRRFLVVNPPEGAVSDSVFIVALDRFTEVSALGLDQGQVKKVGQVFLKDAVAQALNIGVVLRVVDWWLSRRPEGMTEEAHLNNPTVNTRNEEEAAMAKAIARLTQEPLKVFP